jgi:PPOX class probable F420-dependent enzyme
VPPAGQDFPAKRPSRARWGADEALELALAPNPAVLATVRDDGSPHTVAVWFDWVDDRVLLNMDVKRKRLRYVKANPNASITILDGENWLRQLTVRGPISLEPDEGLVTVDRLARRCIGAEYPIRVLRPQSAR